MTPRHTEEGDALVTIHSRLLEHALARPDDVAFRVFVGDHATTITWEGLLRQAASYADWLRSEGVRRGDVVVLCLRHCPSMYAAFLGAMVAGAIPSFVPFPTPKQDPDLYWDAHRILFQRVRPAAVITYGANAGSVAAVVPDVTRVLVNTDSGLAPDDVSLGDLVARYPVPEVDEIALLQHSSGTTGHKKGVMLRHRQLGLYLDRYRDAMRMTQSDRVASWMPLYHDGGLLSAFLCPILAGAMVVSIDAFEWVERPHLLLELIDTEQCQTTWLPNFAFNHLVRTKIGDETYRLDHVRAFVATAEPCKPELIDRFVETFAPHGVRAEQIMTAYGLAEAVMAVTFSPQGQVPARHWFDATALRVGRAVSRPPGPGAIGYLSNGPVVDGIEIRVDTSNAEPGPGLPLGELQFRGSFVFDGYYQNPEATAAVFDGDWLRTGDVGCVLDGEVYVLGRTKDVIIHHGVNYYAHDLEAVTSSVSGVQPGRCVALAVYDDDTGSERVEIVLERDHDHPIDDDELRLLVRRAIADRYQVTVARVHVVAAGWLVKTTSGKMSRSDNLTKLLAMMPDGQSVNGDDVIADDDVAPGDVATIVTRLIATTFDVPASRIRADTVAADVEGWDSLGHTVLMIRLSRALGTVIPEHVPAQASDVGELIEMLRPYAVRR